MSGKSGKSSKAINRPFDSNILRRARQIADTYQIIIHHEDNEYYGRGLEMPTVMADGKTPDDFVKATRDALTTAVASLLETRQTPPPPFAEGKRSEQINVRLTREEKLLLEEAARSRGFRGIGDFVRSTTLSQVR